MINLVYCGHCFKKLKLLAKKARAGKLPEWAYEHICEHFAIYQHPIEISDDFHAFNHGFLEAIEFLEKNNFVYTRETGIDTVKVIPKGYHLEENEWHFCPTQHLNKI